MSKLIVDGKALIVKDTFEIVTVGQKIKDFRGTEHIVQGGTPPTHVGSSGKVDTDRGTFYPGVIGCEWGLYHEQATSPAGCDHVWNTVNDPEYCTKCGISFIRYAFTEAP